MNITIEKINDVITPKNEIDKAKEVEKNKSSKDQLCIKMLDYFTF